MKMLMNFDVLNSWIKFSKEIFNTLPWMIVEMYKSIFKWFYFLFAKKHIKSLHNEVAIMIAAGASAIGNELAYKLSQTNATVVILDRQVTEANENLVQRINDSGEKANFYECDITDRNQLNLTVDLIEREVGAITMIFYGSMLEVDQQSEKLLKLSYVNLIDTIYPRMQTNNKGHLVFLSLINSYRDFKHHQFVEGLFYSTLPELQPSWGPRTGFYMTMIAIHKKFINENSNPATSGILGEISVQNASEGIICSLRKNENFVVMPFYMSHLTQALKLFPQSITKKILNLIYS